MRVSRSFGALARTSVAAAAALVLSLSAGCLEVKEHLTIKADGSGTLVIETQCLAPAEIGQMMRQRGRGEAGLDYLSYPPLSEADATKLFPGKAFTVQVKDNTGKDAVSGVICRVAFKDINDLLASPYGRARSLSVKLEGGKLSFASLSGLLPAIVMSESEDIDMMPTAVEIGKKKNEMAGEFKLTLPNTVASSNGTHAGSSVTWVMDRSKTKDANEAIKLFARPMRAACPGAGIRFAPATPPRLGLLPFNELKEGPTGEKVKIPDAKTVSGAARFVPYVLKIVRTFDLAGEGRYGENEAELVGAVVIPRELAPGRWGRVHLEEAIDDKGNDLKFREDPYRHRWSSIMPQLRSEQRQRKPGPQLRHFVVLEFKVPNRNVKKIARIKADIGLHYFGAGEVLKVAKAIPKELVRDMRRRLRPSSLRESHRELSHPKLTELGLKATVGSVMRVRNTTSFTVRVEGAKASLAELQLFDAQGTRWPTFASSDRDVGEDTYWRVTVPGGPEPPYSLALLVSGKRTSIKVPITLENVPVSGRAKKTPATKAQPK